MYKHTIAESPNGYEIYINFISSSAGKYLSRQPHVLPLIKEVLEPLDLTTTTLEIETDMGRVIGNTDIIETTEKDTIYYALESKSTVYARFAKNRYPAPSNKLTIRLMKDEEGNFEVKDTWVGPNIPAFPGDSKESATSKLYWETHALVQDSHIVQTKSITKVCPY